MSDCKYFQEQSKQNYDDDDFDRVLSGICKLYNKDAVEVVRCRDCTKFDSHEGWCNHCGIVSEQDYCSHGERMPDENN